MNKIAIQGTLGSYHHIVAMKWFDEDVQIKPCQTFKQVFKSLEDYEDIEHGIVAIENSLYGSINEVYDLLLNHSFFVVGEVPEKIHQCLIGAPNSKITDIKFVYSHPVALSQCSDFLEKELPQAKKIEFHDTAASVEHIKSDGSPHKAAIASRYASEIHKMNILKTKIENNSQNFTRFLVIGRNLIEEYADKASLVIETPHKPGALFDVLSIFKENNVNLSKLQSRPIPGKVWRYAFYIDIEADPHTTYRCIEQLKQMDNNVRLLGMYQKALEISEIK